MVGIGSPLVGLIVACLFAYYSAAVESCLRLLGLDARSHPAVVPAVSAIFGYIVGLVALEAVQRLRWISIKTLLTYNDWIYNQRSKKTKLWGMLLSFLLPKKWGTFTFQECLPKYPLPDLGVTLAKTVEVMKPLMSEKEFDEFLEAVQDFSNGEGPALQAVLEKRYQTEDNWLIDLWNNFGYLSWRSPLPVGSNFCTLGMANKLQGVKQTALAACVVHHIMKYKEALGTHKVSGMMIQNMIPICCDRYKFVFSHTRVPRKGMDELKCYENSTHIIVFRQGHMYELDLYSQDTLGRLTLLTPLEIQSALEEIVSDADGKGKAENPGVFTSLERDAWAELREKLKSVSPNGESLEKVESAVFCMELSDDEPKDLSEEFHANILGDCSNRWFDKSFTAIVNKNLSVGMNNEHTCCEATISGRALEYSFFHLHNDADGNATHEGLAGHESYKTPRELAWNLDPFRDVFEKSKEAYNALVADMDAHVRFYHKGKGEIKKQRVSPDGFLQMAMQLAFYRLHGDTPKTYETAATRIFKKGRTETIRPVSRHSVAFTKSFDDASISDSVKIKNLMNAIDYQTRFKYDAMMGRAVDRHLFGLYIAGKMKGKVPNLFTLKRFADPDRLSTSQSPLFYDPVIMKSAKFTPVGGGFGAQAKDGYGVAYFLLGEHEMHFLISSYKSCPDTCSSKFADAIDQAMDDVLAVLQNRPKKASRVVENGEKKEK